MLTWFGRDPGFSCIVRETNGLERLVHVYETSQGPWASMPERGAILETIGKWARQP